DLHLIFFPEFTDTLNQFLPLIILAGNMMTAAKINPFKMRQKLSKLFLNRSQGAPQRLKGLLAKRMKMQAGDTLGQAVTKLLAQDTQTRTRRTGIIQGHITLRVGRVYAQTKAQLRTLFTKCFNQRLKTLPLMQGVKNHM